MVTFRDAFWTVMTLFCSGVAINPTYSLLSLPERNAQDILHNLIPKNYSKSIRPDFGGDPVTLTVSLYITDLASVSERQQDFRLSFYFRHRWYDSRLSFYPKYAIRKVLLDENTTNSRLWLPDTFFTNARRQERIDFALKNGENGAQFTEIESDGRVHRSTFMTVVAICPTDLAYYPWSRIVCELEMESYAYSMADVRYEWKSAGNSGAAIGIASNVSLPGFKVVRIRVRNDQQELASTGSKYSRLVAQIVLVRTVGHLLVRLYLPTLVLVFASFLPLALLRLEPSTRAKLSALLFLTAFLHTGSYYLQPGSVNYVLTSLDCFLYTSLLTILLCLAITSSVAYLSYDSDEMKQGLQEDHHGHKPEVVFLLEKWPRIGLPALYMVYVFVHCVSNATAVASGRSDE